MSAVSPDSAPHPPSAAESASAPLSLTFVKLVTSLTCLSVSRVVARSHNSIMPQIGKGEEGEGSGRRKDGGREGVAPLRKTNKVFQRIQTRKLLLPASWAKRACKPNNKTLWALWMGLIWAMNSKYGVCLREEYFRFAIF